MGSQSPAADRSHGGFTLWDKDHVSFSTCALLSPRQQSPASQGLPCVFGISQRSNNWGKNWEEALPSSQACCGVGAETFAERQALHTEDTREARLLSFRLELTLVWVRTNNFILPSLAD